MKKILTYFFIIIIFIILFNFKIITNNILLAFNICFNSLFPSLIPFIFLSNIIIKYNLLEEFIKLFKPISTIFKINNNSVIVFILSMISGTPSNSKYLKDLYDYNLIKEIDIEKCLYFCHFVNPIFILNGIGINFLNNKTSGYIILISNILASIMLGLIYRNKSYTNNYIYKSNNKNNKFINILNESIINTASTLLIIMGTITFCLLLTGIIDIVFNIGNNYKFLYGFIEITQGLNYLSSSNLNINLKTIIASFFTSFGGFCIHLQVFSILDNKKIRYIPYFISRLLHGILSIIITLFIIHFH